MFYSQMSCIANRYFNERRFDLDIFDRQLNFWAEFINMKIDKRQHDVGDTTNLAVRFWLVHFIPCIFEGMVSVSYYV